MNNNNKSTLRAAFAFMLVVKKAYNVIISFLDNYVALVVLLQSYFWFSL